MNVPAGVLYELVFPNGKRYFGITSRPFSVQLTQHKAAARGKSRLPVHVAIRKYGPENITLNILVVGSSEYVRDAERRAIAAFQTTDRRFGYNVSLGGDANPALLPEVKAVIGAKAKARLCVGSAGREQIRVRRTGTTHADATKAKIRASKTGRAWSNAMREARAASTYVQPKMTEERKQQIREKLIGRKHTDERRKNQSDSHKRRYENNPSVREALRSNMLGKTRSQEAKDKCSASLRGKPWTAERRAAHDKRRSERHG